MHKMTMPQLVLVFDRYPNPNADTEPQPLDTIAPQANDTMLKNLGGVFVTED